MAELPRIWDYLNALTQNKDRSVASDDDFDKQYKPYIINRMLSQHRDCLLSANMMNMRAELPPRSQFHYLLNTLAARFRKNEKASKSTVHDDADVVAEYYGCSYRHALDLVPLHSSDAMTEMRRRLDKGGSGKKGRSHVIP